LRFTLLQLVDCPLGQANAPAEFALAPAENSPRQADLGRKSMSPELNKFAQLVRAGRETRNHRKSCLS